MTDVVHKEPHEARARPRLRIDPLPKAPFELRVVIWGARERSTPAWMICLGFADGAVDVEGELDGAEAASVSADAVSVA